VKAAASGSDSTEARISVDQIIDMWITLQFIVVSVARTCLVFADSYRHSHEGVYSTFIVTESGFIGPRSLIFNYFYTASKTLPLSLTYSLLLVTRLNFLVLQRTRICL
jgi:hypothetical protein